MNMDKNDNLPLKLIRRYDIIITVVDECLIASVRSQQSAFSAEKARCARLKFIRKRDL